MARMLTIEDVEAGLAGGLFLSAGGSGRNAVAKNRGLGRMALDYGGVRLVGLDELDPDALIITATAVGAPGFANWAIKPRDAINAARKLIARFDKPPGRRDLRPRAWVQRLAGGRRARARLRRCGGERTRSSDRQDGRHGARVAARSLDHASRLQRQHGGTQSSWPLSPKATSSAPRTCCGRLRWSMAG